jgi:putative ABC transport system permease protein
VLAYTVALCVLSCLVFGLAPALHATRSSVVSGLKDGSALPGAKFSLRTLLLSVQVAAVVVLLVAAGVMMRSIREAAERAFGREAVGLSVVSLEPPARGYDAARTRALSVEIADALRSGAQPGTLALTSTTPLASGNIKGSFRLPGDTDDQYNAVYEISPEYAPLMGLAIVEGRNLQASDAERSVILINETMAKRYWPGRSGVGQRIVCTRAGSGWNIEGELEIVGVVADAYMSSVDAFEPTIYQPLTHRTLPQAIARDRTAADLAAAAVSRIDPRLRVRVQPLSANLAPRLRSTRVGAVIAGALGLIALGFACVGMFGVFAFWVRQRTQEIGVRLALGAQSSDVIGLVMGTTARAVGIGVGAGLLASVAVSRLLGGFLFGSSGIDPVTYAAVALILVAASLCAAYVPARRATRIDPLVALRYE